MATINLGAIKFNWKGAYNNGTTYAVDDVVSSGGNSYVCIQASTGNAVGNATAYWNIMSSAGTNGTNGTNGTDVGTVITTQGDILYRDGSGLQRLPKGTANQDLRMNSGATAPEWYTASGGGVLQCKTIQTGAYYSTTNINFGTSAYEIAGLTFSITPSSASSYIMLTGMVTASHGSSYRGAGFITYNHSGISETVIKSGTGSYGHTFRIEQDSNGSNGPYGASGINLMFHPNTTNAVEIKCRVTCRNSSYPTYVNGNSNGSSTDADDGGFAMSTLTAWEIAGSITSAVTNTAVAT